MLRAYKYRIYPNRQQAEAIDKTFGVCRFLYNLALETRITAWKSAGINLSAYDLQKQVTELKKDYEWMREVDSQAINDAISNMDAAYKSFFKGGGFPKFKRKGGSQSYGVPRPLKSAVDFQRSKISLPKNSGIKTVFSRTFEGKIRSMTISKSPTGLYFVSVLVSTAETKIIPQPPSVGIGIDLGITHFATLSTGEKINNPKYLRTGIDRLRILQRRASKKRKGSKNKRRALLAVAKFHERIANQREDFLHKISIGLIRDSQADTICLETLPVRNMIKNRRLSQSISDASWGEFVRQLEYKGEWYGKNVIRVGRFYASSKTCSDCGHKVEKLPLSIREWSCVCGANHDRDVNAAINIRNSGLGKAGAPTERSAIADAMK